VTTALLPPQRTYLDYPVSSSKILEAVPAVERVIRELDEGQFIGPTALLDALWRDSRILSGLQTRVNTLLGLPFTYTPGEENARGQQLADEATKLHGRMFPSQELRPIVERGLMLGICPVEILWDTKAEGRWVPTLKAWETHYLSWDWNERCYMLQTQPVGTEDGRIRLEEGDPKWFLCAPWGLQRGWMRGLLRAMAYPWLITRFSYRDWARYCEVHGAPIKKGIIPSNQPNDAKEGFKRQLATVTSNAVVICDKDENTEVGFDIQLVEAMSQTWESFQGLLRMAEEAITIALLGQNLTTRVADGSRAAAQVHDTVRTDLLRFDAESLSTALKSQPIRYWVQYNFEADEAKARALAPSPSWQVEPPRDEADTAATLKTLAEAFNGMNAAGVAVDKRALLDEFKIPYIGNGEMEPKLPPKPGGPDEEKDEEDEDGTELHAMAQGSRRSKPPWMKGQKYADKLVAHSAEAGKKALEVDVADILALIRAAKTPEELKTSLIEFYAGMSPTKINEILKKTGILGRMDGRHSVVEEL